jgi:hypothetical protein
LGFMASDSGMPSLTAIMVAAGLRPSLQQLRAPLHGLAVRRCLFWGLFHLAYCATLVAILVLVGAPASYNDIPLVFFRWLPAYCVVEVCCLPAEVVRIRSEAAMSDMIRLVHVHLLTAGVIGVVALTGSYGFLRA